MNNFDEIIKQKVEQFEVPYNEAHWAEMEGKLNSIRAAKIKNTIMGVAAGIVAISAVGYFLFSNPSNSTHKANNTTVEEENNSIPLANTQNTNSSKEINEIQPNNTIVESTNTTEVVANKLDENNSVVAPDNNSNEEVNKTNINTPDDESPIIVDNNVVTSNKLSAEFIVYNNQVCVGQEVSFEPIENDVPVNYVWNFGDGKISNKTNPKHKYDNSGEYTVTLTLIDRQTGKEYTTIQRDVVTILPSPSTQFTYFEESKKYDDNKLKYPYTTFTIKDEDKLCKYKWVFGNGETSTSSNTKTIYQDAGYYNVTLISENTFGCINSIEKKVAIKNGVNLYAPNALRPNSDIAENAVFIPKALTEWDVSFEMVISNRAGNIIYKTTDKNEPWNGKLNNSGLQAEEGIYFWQVTYVDAYGVTHSFQDKVTLIK